MTTYVSFHTDAYADEARQLRESLEALDLPHRIERRPCLGSWEANCGQKPAFLLRKRHDLDGPIVWLDADARVRREPDWSMCEGYQIGVHNRGNIEIMSGTIWLADDPSIPGLLREWIVTQALHPGKWDQRTLQAVLMSGGYKVAQIPEELCCVDSPHAKCDDPAIWHTQASRRLKAQVGSVVAQEMMAKGVRIRG